MNRPLVHLTFFLLSVLLASSTPAVHSQSRNVYGIQTLVPPDSRSQIDKHLAWAKLLVGTGGHVTQPFHPISSETQGPTREAIAFVQQAYDLGINPIIRLQGQFSNGTSCDPNQLHGWLKPVPDSDSELPEYLQEAAAYERFVSGLPRVDGRTLYVQVWNEPNLNHMWGGSANPAEYARFMVDVSQAIRSIGDGRIKVLNAALAPEGDVDNLLFISEAVATDDAFKKSFDYWASHPYPHNQPPSKNLHDGTALPGSRYTIDSYLLELDGLKRIGVATSKLQVVLTETGYRLEDDWYPTYPVIDENNRAEYIKASFEYWSKWPEVLTATPFQLSDPNGSWREYDWVWSSSGVDQHGFPTQPHLQYASLVQGVGIIRGSVTDQAGKPVKDVALTTDAGGHEALTLRDGTYIMMGFPGTYGLSAEKRGYLSEPRGQVVISRGGTAEVNFRLTSNFTSTPRNPSAETGDLSDWTTWGTADGVQQGKWFSDVKPYDGQFFLGSASNCGEKDGGFYQSVATTPGRSVNVSAWVLTEKKGDEHMASRIGVDPLGGTDPESAKIIWSPWTRTHGEWKKVTLSVTTESDALTLFLHHDQNIANEWNINAFDRIELTEVE